MAWRACGSATATAWVTSWPKPTTTMRRARDTCRHVLRQAHPSAPQSRG
jgi:hypothetical protein